MSRWHRLFVLFFVFPSACAEAGGDRALRIQGMVVAAFTPYTTEGTLNMTVIPQQADYFRRTGVRAVLVGGTTGDSVSLTLSERKALVEEWAPAARASGLTLLVHVGAEALGDVEDLTKHAERSGASGLVCMPTTFFKPATPEAAATWLQRVGASAPRLPLYYYHIPSMTGVLFQMVSLVDAIEQVGVPTFAGVKYTGLYEPGGFPDLELLTHSGKYDNYCGREEMTLEALSIGVRGFIGSQFNFAGDMYGAVQDVFWQNVTRARDIQAAAVKLLHTWSNSVPAGVDGNRLVMEYAGVHIGFGRLPSLPPDEKTVRLLHIQLDEWCVSANMSLGWLPALCKARSLATRRVIHLK